MKSHLKITVAMTAITIAVTICNGVIPFVVAIFIVNAPKRVHSFHLLNLR